ncbi:UNVERIFIED_CONTAM: protein NUCLEAR FUSION defective [Sesamum calycinum]|uniref:Protein NUCLEAR FUSION defective n=1 Tax=Sesamum calycinum TaxID=2727403 RepID=A0AAW2NSS6_9LAMI
MEAESRKWVVLVATTWIQAFAGTNMDFPAYSTALKSALGISQAQLNYVSVASDMGKALGWCSGLCLLYFPAWAVLFVAAVMGLVGYGLQWLLLHHILTLPYFLVLMLSLLAGCSICWFNTVCYVICIKYFPANKALALSLSTSFSGVSGAIYNLIANSIDPNDHKLFLLLNAVVPLITSAAALLLMIRYSPPDAPPLDGTHHYDSANFLSLTAVAISTGLYLLVLNSVSSDVAVARIVLTGAIVLLVLPLVTPLMMQRPDGFLDRDLNKEDFDNNPLFKDERPVVLGEEHSTKLLVTRLDFWLYYVAYMCGGTIALVYSNNLGQISESLGYQSDVGSLVSLYSACSSLGRLLSTLPDFLPHNAALTTATALIGLSSGFVFSAAVSITAELFGPNSAGVNHNILITNIPLGSLVYSLLAALIYEANIGNSGEVVSQDGSKIYQSAGEKHSIQCKFCAL